MLEWADSFLVADSTWFAFQNALDLTVDHQIPIWDALILLVAAQNITAGCSSQKIFRIDLIGKVLSSSSPLFFPGLKDTDST